MFRDKVIIDETKIEYVQFTYENRREIYDNVVNNETNIKISRDKYGKPCLIIPTTNGESHCHIGDYIIKDPNSKDWSKYMCCSEVVFKNLMKIFGRDV